MLKVGIRQELRCRSIIDTPVFAEDFYDRILRPTHSLNVIYDYIRRNPYRLAVRMANRSFFQRRNNLVIEGEQWQAYGNIQLIANPFKEQVVIHRADSPDTRVRNRGRWIHTASNGGVLVSPFISKDEKAIRQEAEASKSKIILISNRPLAEREKPTGHDFEQCCEGRLLILAPQKELPSSRTTFLHLNHIADYISRQPAEEILTGRSR